MSPDDKVPEPPAASAAGAEASAIDAVRQFSHDVINPLTSILNLTEVVLLEARYDDRLNEDLRRIHAATEEAVALVRALALRVPKGADHRGDPGL